MCCLLSPLSRSLQGNTLQALALAGDTLIADMLCGLYANQTLRHHKVQ